MLIGDAAHAVSPNAGQGASQALEDAMMLAKLLRDCACDYRQAFVLFERERKPRVERVVAEGRPARRRQGDCQPLQVKNTQSDVAIPATHVRPLQPELDVSLPHRLGERDRNGTTRRVTSSLGLVQFGKQVMQVEWVGEHLQ